MQPAEERGGLLRRRVSQIVIPIPHQPLAALVCCSVKNRVLVSQIVIPMPHQPQRASVRFLKNRVLASAQRLILWKDYVELNFQFLTLAHSEKRGNAHRLASKIAANRLDLTLLC